MDSEAIGDPPTGFPTGPMTLYDAESQLLYKQALYSICGTEQPPRRQLKGVGRAAASLVGRSRSWSGDHLYVLLHIDRYPKYGISRVLLNALIQLSGIDVIHGTSTVSVLACNVKEGSLVLAKSIQCGRKSCGIDFVPLTPNQKYCSKKCSKNRKDVRKQIITNPIPRPEGC